MNTLASEPLASLLDSLFAQSDASADAMRQQMEKLPPAERRAMLTGTTGYADLYSRAKDIPLAVSRETGALLYMARAQANIATGGLADLVEIRAGDALQTLARDLPDAIDLVLLDGAKGLYPAILSLLEPHLRPGALIVADNADWSADYLARVRSKAEGYMSVPFAEDVELSMRVIT